MCPLNIDNTQNNKIEPNWTQSSLIRKHDKNTKVDHHSEAKVFEVNEVNTNMIN
jgi:hypothetical protein